MTASIVSLDDGAIVQQVRADLERTLGIRATPVRSQVVKHPRRSRNTASTTSPCGRRSAQRQQNCRASSWQATTLKACR